MNRFLLQRNGLGSEAGAFTHRRKRSDNIARSNRFSGRRMLPIVSIICIILSTSFATINAFVPSSTSLIKSNTRVGASSTQMGIAKSGGKMIETEQEFKDNVLSKDLARPVLVFFTAPWCGPCRLTVPVVKDVMKQFSGELDVVEVCTDDLAEVAEESGVVSIPTIQFYYDGASLETHSIVGCVAKSVLSNAVQKVIEDVAQIRQKR